jgi:MFS family permease
MSVSPLVNYTMGLFIQPLEQEFGWSRAAITSALTVNAVIAVFLSPFSGMLVDRIGPRRIGIFGVVVFCLAFGSLAMNRGSLYQWWGHWLLISLAVLALKPTVWVSAIASRFDQSRGLAMALTLSGLSLASVIAPLIIGPIIGNFGWRTAYWSIAAIWAAVVLPLTLAFFYGAADLSRARSERPQPIDRSKIPGKGVKEAMLSANYIKLTLACMLSYFALSAATINLVPIMTGEGVSRTEATFLMSVLGIAAFAGRMLAGHWLDNYSAKLFGALIFSIPTVAFALLLRGDLNLANAIFIVVLMGLASGAEFELASFLTAGYFGLRNYGLFLGTIVGLLGMIAGIAPLFFGYVYDQTGNYDIALTVSMPLLLIAGLLMASLNRVPAPRGRAALSSH